MDGRAELPGEDGKMAGRPGRVLKIVISLEDDTARLLASAIAGAVSTGLRGAVVPAATAAGDAGARESGGTPAGSRRREVQAPAPLPIPAERPPAVDPKASVLPDALICLEDGRRLTMLKRYLRSRFGLTPEQYRARWGLPLDYPMVAPRYAMRRSDIARRSGLGRGRRKRRGAMAETPADGPDLAPSR